MGLLIDVALCREQAWFAVHVRVWPKGRGSIKMAKMSLSTFQWYRRLGHLFVG